MKESVGQMIARGRESKGLSQRELANIAKVSNTEISRIESGEREIPNPKTLRKISKHLDVNYNDLMYAAGLGFQVTTLNPFLINYYEGLNYSDLMYAAGLGLQVSPLNPFLKDYYSGLKGQQIDEALINTLGSIETWQTLVDSFKNKVNDKNISDIEKEIILQTIEDTEYQINTANEIVKLLHSAKTKERINNGKQK